MVHGAATLDKETGQEPIEQFLHFLQLRQYKYCTPVFHQASAISQLMKTAFFEGEEKRLRALSQQALILGAVRDHYKVHQEESYQRNVQEKEDHAQATDVGCFQQTTLLTELHRLNHKQMQ